MYFRHDFWKLSKTKLIIMKNLLILLSIFLFSQKAFSQDYMDLLALIADEKFEKCLFKCEKLMAGEKTKKEPLPYLYASMCYYEMSQDHKFKDDYPKAFKQSLSYLGKYRKKDKPYEYKEDAEEYMETLKFILLEDIENNALAGTEKSAKKSASLVKKIITFDPDDHGAKLIQGLNFILSKNKTEGKKVVFQALDLIKTIGTDIEFGNMTESQQTFLKFALMQYASFQLPTDPVLAKETISLGHQFFYEKRDDCLLDDTSDFKELYDKITG